MNYKEVLDNTARQIENLIITEVDGVEIPTSDYGWGNKRFISDVFRVSHIERYSDKNIEVLHFTCFPTVFHQDPIFGFDVIATDKKPLAAFMDWSPVDNLKSYECTYKFETPYKLPDWAKSIFSKDAIAIVPNDTELKMVCSIVIDSLKEYFKLLNNTKPSTSRYEYIVAKQNYYCEQQQKNERTYNVLKSKLGKEGAKEFMETILFPKLNNVNE